MLTLLSELICRYSLINERLNFIALRSHARFL
jgi:hypothetical protein